LAGQVYRTGRPLIVPDTAKDPYFYGEVDKQAQFHHKSMLDVPLHVQERMIGVLCAVNKREGTFGEADVDLLSAVANLVALPIENARINETLQRTYDNVKGFNRAKEQVIHHLSHELKTPLSVLSASLGLLEKRIVPDSADARDRRIMARARRNLQRLMDMQYEIGDMLREQDYRAHGMLSFLLDACRDMLVTLAETEPGSTRAPQAIQKIIDRKFGKADLPRDRIALDRMVSRYLETIEPRFAHRRIRLETRLEPVAPVWLPLEVMQKIVEGLVKNAIENTPDRGRVTVAVRRGEKGPVFEVEDRGVGITEEKQRLIFNHYFAAGEPLTYATRAPYDFNAGGKGFDLLRMTIFSERYGFHTRMNSRRCRYIPADADLCPGDIDRCDHCRTRADCDSSGGTRMQIRFQNRNP
jgi:signal transduction histidine kinase